MKKLWLRFLDWAWPLYTYGWDNSGHDEVFVCVVQTRRVDGVQVVKYLGPL